MTSVRELEDAIIRDPDNDALRHAIAAHLQSLHNDHGDFIAKQMEAYAYVRRHKEPPPQELERDMKRLLVNGGRFWVRGLGYSVRAYHFRRGFAEEIEIEAARFLEKAAAIVRMAPVRHVRFVLAHGLVDAIMQLPALRQMLSLDFLENGLDDEDCRAIARSPHLTKLRWLGLAENCITEAGVEALARSSTLPSLQYVNLHGNDSEEPSPVLTGLDHDGSYRDEKKSALHRRLVAEVGEKPWLMAAWPGVPDKDAV